MYQPGRKYSVGSGYRYGFNGKELDKDMDGNNYDYGFRIYNPAIGRFLSVDPLFKSYPWYTPYQFAGNKPIKCIDVDGLEDEDKIGSLELDFDETDPHTIWVGTYTTAYLSRQKEALNLSQTNPSKLAVLQQQSFNAIIAKVSEIVLRHFDPNPAKSGNFLDPLTKEISSASLLQSHEVSIYNGYTDYSTPGYLGRAGTTIQGELVSITNFLIVNYRQDYIFRGGKFRAAIEKETDPNRKTVLMDEMVRSNKEALFTLCYIALYMFQPEPNTPNKFPKFSSGLGRFSNLSNTSRVSELMNTGNQLEKGGLLTKAGRALQKHGGRIGSVFPNVTGNSASINSQAEAILSKILTDPKVTTVTRKHARFGNILEYKIPGGQGARFSEDGKTFIGFIEH